MIENNNNKDVTDTPLIRIAAVLFIAAVMIFSLIYFSSFLQPLVLAIIIWYLIFELKKVIGRIKINKKSFPNWLLSLIAFSIILLITFGVVQILIINLHLIIDNSSVYLINARAMLDNIKGIRGFESLWKYSASHLLEFDFKPLLTDLLNSLSIFAGNIFLIIIYVVFLLVEEKHFSNKINKLILNDTKLKNITDIIDQISKSIRTYTWMKTWISLIVGFVSYIILVLFQVDFPILWAFLIFVLNFIPYVGALIATLFPSVFAAFQFQSFWMFLWIFLAMEAVHVVIGNILEPKIMGRTLNLSPLGVLLALAFWGIIWGVLGMIISVPITSIMVIILANFESTRFISIWFSETGDLEAVDA